MALILASLLELCRRAGIHDLTFHDLRHSAATWLLEAGVNFAVIEKLLGHRLHGMGEGYIHNWQTRLHDAVTRLEAVVLDKFRQAEAQGTSGVGSYGQLMGSWKIDGLPKWLISGAEGQNRTVDTSLFRAVLYQLSYLGVWARFARGVSVYRITEEKSTFQPSVAERGGFEPATGF